jgi:hypothetical protein
MQQESPQIRNGTANGRIAPTGGNSAVTGYGIWIIALGTAVAVDLVIGNAVIASILPCLHIASGSARSGFWLLRSDPMKGRARTCFWFYLAAAFWAATAFALLGIPSLMVIEAFSGKPPSEEQIAATMLTVIASILSTAITGIVAIVLAVRNGTRVWVHPGIRDVCRGDFNRLMSFCLCYMGLNRAMFVVVLSLFFPVVIMGTGLLIWAACDDAAAVRTTVTTIVGFGILLGGPLAMIPVYAFFSSRIIAKTPSDCWPPDPLY